MDLDLFLDILSIESTSGHERALANFIEQRFPTGNCRVTRVPTSAEAHQPVNLLLAWGDPQIVYCSHMDTVPPYLPPTVERLPDGDTLVSGRGTCDAKGQIMAMYTACKRLAEEGHTGFGLLLLHGEETGSYGAKEYRLMPGGKCVIVGEPTDGLMVSASKGTKAFELAISGKSFHSGYPQYGHSAIDTFVDLIEELRASPFPVDPELGETTYNVGKLVSDNPQNILSPLLTCRIYFRTTFASDAMVSQLMQNIGERQGISVTALGGDTPTRYLTLPRHATTTVAFGSDAPQLTNFEHKMLCGPGSILVAHTAGECIKLSQIEKAAHMYVQMYHQLSRTLA